MRVLVIEDDRSVRETLGMVLESYELEVDLADGAQSAMEYLEMRWPDVMLLDLSLNGMTGEELYSRIQARFKNTPPTIVLSAVQHGEDRIKNMPNVVFLAKPYTIDDLIQMIHETASPSIGQLGA